MDSPNHFDERCRLQLAALEAAHNAIAIINRKGEFVWANNAYTRLTGYETREILGKNPRILKSGLTDPMVYVELWKTITRGRVWAGEIFNRRKDGSLYLQELTITPVLDENGTVSHFVAVTQDITSRKKNEEELHLFRCLIDRVNDSVFIIDAADGAILDVNGKACSTLGYTREDLLCLKVRDIDLDAPDSHDWKQKSDELRKAGSILFDGRQRKKDGSIHPVEVFLMYTVINQKEYFIAVARDVSEKRRLENQLRQSQKMEAVGRLAGGVAHDFNNLLTAILGLSEISIKGLSDESPIRADLEEIRQITKRAARLTHQLLAFSRQQILEPAMTDVNELIRGLEKMLHRLIEESIEFVFVSGKFPLMAMVDPGQIEQVIVNLAVNARDAMPNGGKLTIRTSKVAIGQEFRLLHPEAIAGDYACISVSDTGTGISEDIKTHIFEPFFTTKPKGKGTGLGLATCYGIIKQSRGYIYVQSEEGKGTVFQIYFPLVSKPAAVTEQPLQSQVDQGSETLLLVEDDPAVRRLSARMLRNHGYTVLEGLNGMESLQIAKDDNERRICLMLTDVVMPVMNGKQLADELSLIRPDIRVVFTSGYTDDFIFRNGILETGVAFLRKPFSTEALIKKVREVLDRPAAA